jgi:hypothetical protein
MQRFAEVSGLEVASRDVKQAIQLVLQGHFLLKLGFSLPVNFKKL